MDAHSLPNMYSNDVARNILDESSDTPASGRGAAGVFRTDSGGSFMCSGCYQHGNKLKKMEVLQTVAMQQIKANSKKLNELTVKFDGRAASIEGLKTRLDNFEKSEKSEKSEKKEKLEQHIGTGGSKSAGQDNELARLSIEVANQGLRCQILETASYDGVLIWKIKDYNRRKRDAISGKTHSLYSQPFYTSRFGYKMCARAYLNGDGMGKNTHCSLFLVMMKGDYDALLPWPFRQQKVEMFLLDQSSFRKHLSEKFKPDPSSSSFQRPTTDMNTASGCPRFVTQERLEDSKTYSYLKDDTVFFKIIVDTKDLFV